MYCRLPFASFQHVPYTIVATGIWKLVVVTSCSMNKECHILVKDPFSCTRMARIGSSPRVTIGAPMLWSPSGDAIATLSTMAIGSNREKRERACKLALAVAATKDPRFVTDMSGSLQIVADGCQIVEMNDQGTTAAWDGSRRDAEHVSDANNSSHRLSHQEVAISVGQHSTPSVRDTSLPAESADIDTPVDVVPGFRIGGDWSWDVPSTGQRELWADPQPFVSDDERQGIEDVWVDDLRYSCEGCAALYTDSSQAQCSKCSCCMGPIERVMQIFVPAPCPKAARLQLQANPDALRTLQGMGFP